MLSIELATASFLGTREKSWILDEKTKKIKAQSHRRSQNLTQGSKGKTHHFVAQKCPYTI